MMFVNKNEIWFDCISVTKGVLHLKKKIEENATEMQVKKDIKNFYKLVHLSFTATCLPYTMECTVG